MDANDNDIVAEREIEIVKEQQENHFENKGAETTDLVQKNLTLNN